ncbi:rab9 effector protein with kelch motifs-like isoform X2 [Dendropsophus ebraccatus]|uniref:rab9 effector protein with kelch motifs-like isoform X2 n=1 Tax=Dendropsophus ebraccatus TaxID=150705 RepID=UPI0038316EF4
MGRVEFYALWSVLEAPRQLISKGGRMSFQLPLPLPLPQHLLLFSLGDWGSYSRDACVTAQLVTGTAPPQHIGTLSAERRSFLWDGEWSLEIVMECVRLAAQGMPAKLCLSVSGKVHKGSGFRSSTPARRRLSAGPPSSPLLSESTIAHVRLLEAPAEEKGCGAEVTQLAACAILKDSPPLKKVALSLPLVSKDGGSGEQDPCRRGHVVPRNPRRLRFGSKGCQDGTVGAVCPSARWGHSTCLCDPETAILIGGEGANEKPSPDSLWKLELDSDFWFRMDNLCSGSAPQCSKGHTATFDPETKKLYVYGGMQEKCWLSNVYVLDTLDWKWMMVTAVGKVPTLTHHTATMYQRELYVFGGLCPQVGADFGVCTNALYIFNPEYKIWYQPIVEGERPLPRYGHSATLLGSRLVVFGGRRSPSVVYLNDLHILDLGYMEYTAVTHQSLSERPSPRCFHAAMQVSEQRLLIHGGCSGSGSLTDAFIFSLDTMSWSSISFGGSSLLPRAGHTLLNLTSSSLTDSDKEKRKGRSLCRVLIIGGSDGSGTFYSDNPKFQLDLSG